MDVTPLRQYDRARCALDLARQAMATVPDDPSVGSTALRGFGEAALANAEREYRRSVVRLALSAAAFLVVASVAVVMLWGLIVLVAAAFDAVTPAPTFTPIQLPTV